jgi:hypothetical protein
MILRGSRYFEKTLLDCRTQLGGRLLRAQFSLTDSAISAARIARESRKFSGMPFLTRLRRSPEQLDQGVVSAGVSGCEVGKRRDLQLIGFRQI